MRYRGTAWRADEPGTGPAAWRLGVVLVLAALAAGAAGCQQAGSYATWTLQPKFLVADVEHFRTCIHADPEQAIPDRMAPEAATVFHEVLDAAYGPSYPDGRVPPAVFRRAWRYFFDTSIYMVHYPGPKSALVLFYNPYTDTAAILRWDETDEGLRVGDAEVLTGDYLRGRHRPPYSPAAGWRAREALAAAAVAETTYETTEGFGRLFAGLRPPPREKVETMSNTEVEAMLERLADWRSHAPGLAGGKAQTGNRVCAGARLRLNLLALDILKNTTRRKFLMEAVNAVFDDLVAGRAERVLARAEDTPAPAAGAIREVDPADWKNQALVSYAVGPDEKAAFAFTTRWDQQNAFLCFSFVPGDQEDTWSLRRIDYVNCRAYARVRKKQDAGEPAQAAARRKP